MRRSAQMVPLIQSVAANPWFAASTTKFEFMIWEDKSNLFE